MLSNIRTLCGYPNSVPKSNYLEECSDSLLEWVVNGIVIRVLNIDGQFEAASIDPNPNARKKEVRTPISSPKDTSSEQLRSEYQHYAPILLDDRTVEFVRPDPERIWNRTTEKMVTLLTTKKGKLIWQIFDLKSRTSVHVPESSYEQLPLADRIAYLKREKELGVDRLEEKLTKNLPACWGNPTSAFAKTSDCLLEWKVNSDQIRLQKSGRLEIFRVDLETKQKKRSCIQLQKGFSPEELISKYSQCAASISSDGTVDFIPLAPKLSWHEGKQVSLLQKCDGSLIWQITDTSNGRVRQVPNTLYDNLPSDERIKHLRRLRTDALLAKIIESISAKSQFAEHPLFVTQFNWATSLICAGRSSKYTGWRGHAQIAIEGIEQRFPWLPFISYAHLGDRNGGTVLLEERANYPKSTKGKHITWNTTSDQVEKMLDRIRWEVEMQKKHDPQVFFSIMGSDSNLARPVKIREFKSLRDLHFFLFKNPKLDEQWFHTYMHKTIYIGKNKSLIVRPGKRKGYDFALWVVPDNCITYARKRLALAGVNLETPKRRQLYTSVEGYTTSTPAYKQPSKGQPHVTIPVLFHGTIHELDLTDKIQNQLGKCAWRLPVSETRKLELIWKVARERSGLLEARATRKKPTCSPMFDMMMFFKDNRFALMIEVNGELREVDLSDELLSIQKRAQSSISGGITESCVRKYGEHILEN